MHDPVADMLTRIRNGQRAHHEKVTFCSSKLKMQVAQVLKDEGYITDFVVNSSENNIKQITVTLKYYQGMPVIEHIARVSRPGRRVYANANELNMPKLKYGIAILSTSKGIMTHNKARKSGIGGEVLCEVA